MSKRNKILKVKLGGTEIKEGRVAYGRAIDKKISKEEKKGFTCKDLLNSDLVGIWKDRTDINDTVKFVEEFRKKISRRGVL